MLWSEISRILSKFFFLSFKLLATKTSDPKIFFYSEGCDGLKFLGHSPDFFSELQTSYDKNFRPKFFFLPKDVMV